MHAAGYYPYYIQRLRFKYSSGSRGVDMESIHTYIHTSIHVWNTGQYMNLEIDSSCFAKVFSPCPLYPCSGLVLEQWVTNSKPFLESPLSIAASASTQVSILPFIYRTTSQQ